MLWYNFKYAIRNILRQKTYSITNIIGLSVSLASVFLILYYIQFETGFDQYFSNSDRVVRFTIEYQKKDYNNHFARVKNPVIQYLADDFPEVEYMARLSPFKQCAVKIGENKFYSKGAYATDSNYFKVFNGTLLLGNPNKILNSKGQAVISESLRNKFFGPENPIGKQISLEHLHDPKFHNYTIVGILKDVPAQSHFHPEILISLENQADYSAWNYTYLLLDKAESIKRVSKQFNQFKKKHFSEKDITSNILHLQAIHDIHLHSNKDREIEINGDIKNIHFLILLTILIFLVALLNFTNINIVSTKERSRNILINHLLGGKLQHIAMVALWQNLLIVGVSVVLGIGLARIAYSSFQQLFYLPDFIITKSTLKHFLQIIFFLIVCGSLIGTLPLLKHKLKSNLLNKTSLSLQAKSGKKTRGVLLSLQFAIVVGLLITTFVIQSQINLLMENRLGGTNKNIINITDVSPSLTSKYDLFKNKLLKISGIENVTASMEEPSGEIMDAFPYHLEGVTQEEFSSNPLNVFTCDHNFLDFYHVQILAGNNFTSDTVSKQYILNKTALQYIDPKLQAEDFLNRSFEFNFFYKKLLPKGQIVGICDDLHLTSMNEKEKPLAIHYQNMVNSCISIRFTPEALQSALSGIQDTWQELFPDYALSYQFIDDLYLQRYQQYINQRNFLSALSLLAILIACIGLIAISISIIQARKREISIRKVNGAKSFEIIHLLNKYFLKWVVIAFVFACPIAWYAMHKWLENFAYKTELSWWIFALAGLIALGIALLTVSFQSWRAATRNPVESLRYE
ncbi:FtsX-like permease family protein [Labilibaculum sp. A4]|uniref:ABC transporter permease n=1 Tax=Labilibaculum euxinus TaxID=2686357 RepID=UPI000F626871|nr:ABC transporter permease [Labilibaculum euxinus]MDQ1769975.1 ABC transporter permease [Labilibaculum euxinus]MWN77397.1 FtsX-like permease family protein [Labilibaculum euxinus]